MRGVLAAVWMVAASACMVPVTAKGTLRVNGPEVVIQGSNGKSRPLATPAGALGLPQADGLLVELEGSLRRGAIVVDRWQVTEGPHGLEAWVGVVRDDGRDLMLHLANDGARITLDPAPSALEGEVGQLVLVEGIVVSPTQEIVDGVVVGGLTVQVMAWRPLH